MANKIDTIKANNVSYKLDATYLNGKTESELAVNYNNLTNTPEEVEVELLNIGTSTSYDTNSDTEIASTKLVQTLIDNVITYRGSVVLKENATSMEMAVDPITNGIRLAMYTIRETSSNVPKTVLIPLLKTSTNNTGITLPSDTSKEIRLSYLNNIVKDTLNGASINSLIYYRRLIIFDINIPIDATNYS